MPFVIASPAFETGQTIPPAYTCDGTDISPPLVWQDPPPGTQSFVLVLEDPDAPGGIFHHWGVFDIPASQTSLPAGVPLEPPDVVINDFRQSGYGGPCPPKGGGLHHYHFRLAALSRAKLTLPPHADVATLWQAAAPYVISQVEFIGTYAR